MCDPSLIRSFLKEEDESQPLPFNFALRYVIRNVQVNTEELNLCDTHHYLFNVHGDVILGDIPHCEEKCQRIVSRF